MCRLMMLALFVGILHVDGNSQETTSDQAATVADAIGTIDFAQFPLVHPDGEPHTRVVSTQSYLAKGSVDAVVGEIKKHLDSAGFAVAGDEMIMPTYATVAFEKNSFLVNLTVLPSSQGDSVNVTLKNLGNVALSDLPVPKGAKPTYSSNQIAMFEIDKAPEDAKKVCRAAFEQAGWHWFGDTTTSFFMRQHAVRAQVMVIPAPAQEGKTMIQYSTEQLSREIPVPEKLQTLQYSDNNGRMVMDSESSIDEFIADYSERLRQAGWKNPSGQAQVSGETSNLLFLDEAGNLMECEIFTFEGMTRCRTIYKSAEQIKQLRETVDKQNQSSGGNASRNTR